MKQTIQTYENETEMCECFPSPNDHRHFFRTRNDPATKKNQNKKKQKKIGPESNGT